MTRPEQSKGGLIRGTPEWDAEIRDIVDTCERDSSHEHWIVEPLAGMFWPAVQADIEAERRRRRSAINQRGHGMSETFVRYQCSENPKHRGWREADEPRGTCEFCLAVTRWEQEAVGGRREAAPSHLLPEVRFPHLYAPVPEDSA